MPGPNGVIGNYGVGLRRLLPRPAHPTWHALEFAQFAVPRERGIAMRPDARLDFLSPAAPRQCSKCRLDSKISVV